MQQRNLVTNLLAEAKSLVEDLENSENSRKAGEQLLRAHRGLPKTSQPSSFSANRE